MIESKGYGESNLIGDDGDNGVVAAFVTLDLLGVAIAPVYAIARSPK